MTLGQLRPFFSGILTGLNLREWTQAFSVDNIPSSIVTESFHVGVGQISLANTELQLHRFKTMVTVRVFFKGYRDPNAVKDAALDKAQVILNAVCKPSVRLGTDGLADIRPVTVNPQALAATNENSLLLELVFEVVLNYRFT